MIIDVDPTKYLPQPKDIVRFTNGRFLWIVTHTIPYTNTVYVRSELGNRPAVAAITNILTIQRDTRNRWHDNTEDYIEGAWEAEDSVSNN